MRFQVLGPVVASGERGPVPLGSARQRTVLAVLLTELGRPVGFDQLVDRVWGSAPPQRARQTLHTYLSRIRTVLGDAGGPALVRRMQSYQLEADPTTVDLHRFRALSDEARRVEQQDRAAALWGDALGLWRGAPFAGLESDWLRGTALALEAERLAALLDRNDVLLRRGEHARLLPELSAAAGEHPLDERLAGQLMLALYRCGRQAAALAHYRELHDRLVEELGSDPSPALRALHQRILRQDPALASAAQVDEPPEAPPVTADGPADYQPAPLPTDIAGFTGRHAALRQLDALLGPASDPPSTVVISAIGGCGGIGKTALAVHWAHRVRDRFPDGQLYLNLRGFGAASEPNQERSDPTGQAMSAADALRALLELLQVPPERIPTTVEAQAGLYRGRLAGARMLVVLDNARDADQVRPLLPGSPGCMVLVTSRNQLTGLVAAEGARPVRLDVLEAGEARQLLTSRLGARRVETESAAVDQIITACGGLPLALSIVAARAAACTEFPLAVFAGELADARGRLDALAGPDPATDLRAVFSWSYQALSPLAARLFRLLGLHPGPDIGLAAAANLAGAPAPQVRRLLAELTGAHLLTEHAPGRYAFHDLVHAYATELAGTDPDDDRRVARDRMLDYYLHSAHAADRWLPTGRDPITLTPPRLGVVPDSFADNPQARAWLADELPVLVAVIEQAYDAGLDRQVQQLAWTLTTFLLWRGLWHHKIAVQDAGLRAAQRLGDQRGQATIHRRLAHAREQLGQRDEAHAHLQQSLTLCREIGDYHGQARTHLVLAWLLSEQEGRYAEGLWHAQECLESARSASDGHMQALAQNAIGWCQTLLGEHELAIIHCDQAIAELTARGERAGLADAWSSLGHAYHQLGQHQQAIDYYRQAAEWTRDVGDRRFEASILTQLGQTYRAIGEEDDARSAWQRALEIYEEIGHPDADELRKKLK